MLNVTQSLSLFCQFYPLHYIDNEKKMLHLGLYLKTIWSVIMLASVYMCLMLSCVLTKTNRLSKQLHYKSVIKQNVTKETTV